MTLQWRDMEIVKWYLTCQIRAEGKVCMGDLRSLIYIIPRDSLLLTFLTSI